MTYLDIGHNQLGNCNEKPPQCVIYARTHKSKNHKYEITGYIAKRKKIWIYVIPKCANYGGNHQATIFRYSVKQKTQAKI